MVRLVVPLLLLLSCAPTKGRMVRDESDASAESPRIAGFRRGATAFTGCNSPIEGEPFNSGTPERPQWHVTQCGQQLLCLVDGGYLRCVDFADGLRLAQQARAAAPIRVEWKVECKVDDLKATRSCALGNGNIEAPFEVVIFERAAPVILAGIPNFPGRGSTTVRVDSNDPVTFVPTQTADAELKSATLIDQLLVGQIARFGWEQWPKGPSRAEQSLAGFRHAYEELLRQRDQEGATSWKQSP